ncbi:MAG: copper chaperone PCu(A)C [Pseudomonadota bacterium]
MNRLLIAAAAACFAFPAFAAEIMAMKPYAYATTHHAKAGGAYVSLMSHGATDRLVSAASDAAKRVEIHTHKEVDGVMKMREVEGPLTLSPDTPITMEPGGIHVMLMGLNGPLTEGETLDVTLTFEKAGEMTVTVPVVARDAAKKKGHGDHSHGAHKHGS